MGLKIWLPLDGDLRNLGASNVEVTNNGATIDNAGKIGKCYYFNGSTYLKESNYDWSNFNISQFSLCCWYKEPSPVASGNSQIICIGTSSGWNNIRIGLLRRNSNGYPMFSISNGSSAIQYGFTASKFTLDNWNHIAVTYNNGELKMYLNGVIDKTSTTTITPVLNNSQHLGIGSASNGAEKLTGYLNDIRIYDHCLSAAEVKEIAQGLVLHYKLDNGSQEIITNIPSTNVYNYPTFNTSAAGGGWNHWGPSGHSSSYGQNVDKKYIYNKNNTYSHWITEDAGTGKYYLLYQSPAFEGGYRSLQAIIKEENGLPITESICYPTWNARNGGVPNNKWTSIKFLGDGFYYCCCEGISQNGSNDLVGIDVMPGYKIYVSECYLENNTETCSPIFTYSSNTVQDSSGYGRNGTIVGTSTSNISTPRYNNSLSMNNTSTSNHIETDAFTLPDVISVSFWAKANKSTNQVLFADPLNSIEFGFLNSLAYVKTTNAAGWTTTNFINNEWNHIVVEKNGSTFYLYINETLETQNGASNYYMHNGTKLWLLNRSANNNYAANASISDFRIYCTPLLDTDIKLLYNMGMRVDNLGGVHAFEFNEKGDRELLAGVPITTSYSNHTNVYTNYTNGEIKLTGSSSVSTPYIPISPSGKTYYYDLDVSVDANNQVYIGFERYDANKTARSNNATVYVMSPKPSTALTHQRYRGTVNLSTDGVNPCAFITLRILNDWSGAASRSMTVHKISLREVTTIQSPKLYKTGIFTVDELNEHLKSSLYKNGFVEATEFIEI